MVPRPRWSPARGAGPPPGAKRVSVDEGPERPAERTSRADHPSAGSLREDVAASFEEGLSPDCGERHPVADVKIGVAIVQRRIARIEIAQIADTVGTTTALREGRAQVVLRVRVGVVRHNGQARVVDVLRLKAQVQAIVVREALRSTVIDGGPLLIGTGKAKARGSADAIKVAARGRRRQRITQVLLPAAQFIDVLDVVQVNAMRAVVLECEQSAGAKAAFQAEAVELSLSNVDVLIDVARAGWVERRGAVGSGEGAQVVAWETLQVADLRGGIRGRVLNHVVSHVAEVAFVADAPSTTEGGGSIAEEIPRKTNAGTDRSPARVPQTAHRTPGSNLNRPIPNLVEVGSARA